MSSAILQGSASGTGSVTLLAPVTNSNQILTLPDATATLLTNKTAGTVLQVVSYDYTGSTSYSVSNTSAQTPCAVSITPSSTSSKILIIGRLTMAGNVGYIGGGGTIYRNSTLLSQGTAGTVFNTTSGYVNPYYINSSNAYDAVSVPLSFLDSPSTTSSITYYLGVSGISGVGVVYVNRGKNSEMGYTSNIICMEIAG